MHVTECIRYEPELAQNETRHGGAMLQKDHDLPATLSDRLVRLMRDLTWQQLYDIYAVASGARSWL
jgi:hypothetical protein